jgi:hypothetical protein
MRGLLVALVLVLPFTADAQDYAKPMPAKELAEFLGPVSREAISWTKLVGPDFDVYHGQANPPLSGVVSFYLGGHPSFKLETGSTIVEGMLGIFPVRWHRVVTEDGSVKQRALIRLDDYWQVDIWVHAKRQKDLDKLLTVISRLPTFTQKPKPLRTE